MDKMLLNQMKFYGYHGVLPEENKLGQVFLVDLELFLDLKPAAKADNLELTVNYAEVFSLCREIVEKERFRLIESLAERIAEQVLVHFDLVLEVMVRVIKPNPPIPGCYDSVAVEIKRGR